ncbi:MAG TPA: amino acid permease [Gemmataceae bacterium]|jgi:APA family basic amino acid/polyamine antiporter|nr:amino acid permease [Gemmataceae bacterium]
MSTGATPHEGPATGEPAPAFRQRLGLFDATMLVAGSMIGSGIFIVPAAIAGDVGSSGWILAVWVLTGGMTIFGALSYGELAAMMPRAGGQYVYLREAYSPLWGFLYGWTLFLVIQTGTIAAVGVAFAKFLGVMVPALGTDPGAGARVLFETSILWPQFASQPVLQPMLFQVTAGQAVGVFVVVLLTAVNCLGVQEGKWVQNLFTVAKMLALALLIVLGFALATNSAVLAANTQDWWAGIKATKRYEEVHAFMPLAGVAALMVMGGAMVGSLFAADAWNNVTFTAGEVRNPRRSLPLSLALGTGMVIGLYLLANVVYLTSLPVRGDAALAEQLKEEAKAAKTPADRAKLDQRYKEATLRLGIDHARDERVGTAVMELVAPSIGVQAMAIGIMLSTFGCTNGLILSGARLYYAMARDGLFFRSVGRLNRHGVPAAGLILQAVWASLLTFSGTYGQLLDYVIFAALLFYVLTATGLFVLRRKRPDAERPYRAVGYPVVPAVYVFLCAVVMLDLLFVKPLYTWPGLVIVLSGIPVYFLWRRQTNHQLQVTSDK